jgi:hypothetical protein
MRRHAMRRRGRSLCLGLLLAVGLLLAAVPAQAGHDTDPHTKNLKPMGHTDDNRPVTSFFDPFFTDVAFWGKVAVQGIWFGGFRTIDISSPARPRVLSEVDCGAFQGDVGVWGNLVFRSVDTPVAATTPEETCDAPWPSLASRASRSSGSTTPPALALTISSPPSGPTAAPTPTRSFPTPSTTGC